MAVPINAVIDEAIRYEQGLAALYQAFCTIYPGDVDLWWELSVSEAQHAALLESSSALFSSEFSRDTVPADLDALRRSNDALASTLVQFQKESVPREEAFRLVIGMETDDNELTLHRLLEISPSRPAHDVVDRLRQEDLRHVQKIREYASRHNIAL